MQHGQLITIGALAFAVGAGACNREPAESRTATPEVEGSRTAELQRERDEEITRFDERLREVEREYGEASAEVASGAKKATSGLREELKEDVTKIGRAHV